MSSAIAGQSGAFSQQHFSVAGISLGIDHASVLKMYPNAETEGVAASCYKHGKAIERPVLTKTTLSQRLDKGRLLVEIEPALQGGRVSKILYEHTFDAWEVEISKMLDHLTARFGPFDRKLYRRKMEPAGRIIGFEWRHNDGSSLRVVWRRDHANGNLNTVVSYLAQSAFPTAARLRKSLPAGCELN